jgi:hypothetical protein
MDILINTYDTKYENELKSWYQDYNLKYMSNTELIGFKLVQDALDGIDINQYDFIFITRMDILIKPYFLDIFNPRWNKIYFSSQHWTKMYYTKYGSISSYCGFDENSKDNLTPYVNPTFEFIPKNYFKVLSKVDVNPWAWSEYKKTFDLKNDDMDFMIDTYHEANSQKDFNPLYKMVGRPESEEWFDKDKKIDRSLFGTNTELNCESK